MLSFTLCNTSVSTSAAGSPCGFYQIGKETIKIEHGDSTISFYGIHPRSVCLFKIYNISAYLLKILNIMKTGSIGEIVALACIKDKDILGAKFDLNKVKSKRHNWGVFRDRRLKLYKVLLSVNGNKTSQF